MKKLLCSLFFAVVLFNVFVVPSFTQTPTQPPPAGGPTQAVRTAYPIRTDADVPQDFHTYTQNVFIEILTSISCMLTGYDPLTVSGKCLGINTATHKIGYVESQGGAIGIVGNMISMTFNIPVSSTTYARDLASNFGITKSGYAAIVDGDSSNSGNAFSLGYGYTGLQPVLNVWKIFRNLVYLLLVLLFIVIGLGIMFRLNIDARSVMSIQNQLPKIIIGIILVTFSYAIAGFIVDIMYVLMYLVYYLFAQQTLGLDMGGLNPAYLQGQNPLGAIGGLGGASDIATGVAKPLGHIFTSLFDNSFGHMIATIVGGIIGGGAGAIGGPIGIAVGAGIGLIVGGVAGSKLLGVVGGLIAYIVITITIVWAMLRLWFLLLRSYLFFLFAVVLAPFWIGLGLVPKGGAGFNSWIREVVANLAVFPATLFILLLGKTLVSQFGNASSKTSFVPPLVGNPGDASSFGPIIGLGIILLLPSVVTMVRDTLKAPGFKYTQAIGASLGQGQKIAGLVGGKAREAVWKSNHRTGEPEGLKKWYIDKFNHATQNSKVTKGLGAAKNKITRNLPGGIGRKQRNIQAHREIDQIRERGAQTGSIVGANSQYRGSTVNGRAVRDLNNGMFEVEGAHGTTVQMREEDVPWDRMTPEQAEEARIARAAQTNPIQPNQPATSPTGAAAQTNPTRDQRVQARLDERIAAENIDWSTLDDTRKNAIRAEVEQEIDLQNP